MTINSFRLVLNKVSSVYRDGIAFKDIMFIDLIVDNKSIYELSGFENSFIYFEELQNSTKNDGKYLIITCACGVADDGGWQGVEINHKDSLVIWDVCGNNLKYFFDTQEYKSQIDRIAREIKSNNHLFELQPKNVVFPEEWD